MAEPSICQPMPSEPAVLVTPAPMENAVSSRSTDLGSQRIAPESALEPKVVPCGPRSTSMRSMSKSFTSACLPPADARLSPVTTISSK